MKKIFVIVVFVIASSLSIVYAQPVNGELVSDTGNIRVVKVWGTHYQRGFAYGYLCSQKIFSVYNNYILPNFGGLLPLAKSIIGNQNNFSIDTIYVTEAKAMLDGMANAGIDTAGISYLDLFVVNFITDLSGFITKKEIIQNCSSLMDWGDATLGTDLNGKSVISHHLDASPLDTNITNNQVVIIHVPSETNEQPWILTGTAGQMAASQAFNIHGVTAFLNTVNGFTALVNKGYEPVTLAIRKGLEKVDFNNDGLHNVNDIRDALSSNTNGYASGFIVCSLAPSTAGYDSLIAMVAELAPQQPYVTFRYNNYTDSIDGDNLYAANDMVKRNNAQIYCSRYLNVSNVIHTNYNGQNIGSSDNWNIMKTQSVQNINLQFIQVIPEDCVFKIAVSHYGNPAYQFAPQVFNFCELFSTNIKSKTVVDEISINLFPNPSVNNLNIEITNATGLFTVEIYNVLNQKIHCSEIGKKSYIDISNLPKGIYLLKIYSKNVSQIKKFVKQ
ncbi:MAG: hypothetical protein A2X08_08920 [Bacteroidetes bacterium GWA2_32_17]|nr:MAG: hypothetical protein A2X08_08920 [Bacteroidetes bacterium GWA2_32_17]